MFLIGTHIQEIDKSSYNMEKTTEKVSSRAEHGTQGTLGGKVRAQQSTVRMLGILLQEINLNYMQSTLAPDQDVEKKGAYGYIKKSRDVADSWR